MSNIYEFRPTMFTADEKYPSEKLILLCNIHMLSRLEAPRLFQIVNESLAQPFKKEFVENICWLLKVCRVTKDYTAPVLSFGSMHIPRFGSDNSRKFIEDLSTLILPRATTPLPKRLDTIQRHLSQHTSLPKEGTAMRLLSNHGLLELCPTETLPTLFEAIAAGDLSVVEKYAKGNELFTYTIRTSSSTIKFIPFRFAVAQNQLQIANYLLNLIIIKHNTYAALKLLREEFNESLEILVKQGENDRQKNDRISLITRLLRLGANPNYAIEQNTLLHIALENRCLHITETLYAYGANPHAMNKKGQTPIDCFHSLPWTLSLKQQQKIAEDMWSLTVPAIRDGQSDLQKTIDCHLFGAIKDNSLRRVKLYTNKFNCNPTLYNSHIYAHHPHAYVASVPSLFLSNLEGWGPAEHAVGEKRWEIVKFLLGKMAEYKNDGPPYQMSLNRILRRCTDLKQKQIIDQLVDMGGPYCQDT